MKMRFGRLVAVLTLSASALVARESKGSGLGYTLDVTTFYQFGVPSDLTNGISGSPDTGFFRITNNGTTTFTGTIGDTAVAPGPTNYSFASTGLTLIPGQSASFGINGESSNVGGFNGPYNTVPQPGVTIFLNGLINGTEATGLLTVNDADIHSGGFRTNPYGVTLDSYVLQGGDPLGRDTGDGFETTQKDGHFQFFMAPTAVAPLPSTLLVGMALFAGLGLVKLSRRSVVTA